MNGVNEHHLTRSHSELRVIAGPSFGHSFTLSEKVNVHILRVTRTIVSVVLELPRNLKQ